MREPAHRRSLDAVVAAFVADCRARNLSPATIESYLEGIRAYRSTLKSTAGDQTLSDLELVAARAWVAGLTEHCRPATVANRVRALKVFSRSCVAKGFLRDDHLIRLRRLRSPGPWSSRSPTTRSARS
jgi:site-specific recombinase XerD